MSNTPDNYGRYHCNSLSPLIYKNGCYICKGHMKKKLNYCWVCNKTSYYKGYDGINYCKIHKPSITERNKTINNCLPFSNHINDLIINKLPYNKKI